METLAAYGVAAVVVIAVAWISIATAIREAKDAAVSKAKEKASEEARKAEQEMSDEVVTPITNEEAKDRFRRGDA